jgi:hypothetical protein
MRGRTFLILSALILAGCSTPASQEYGNFSGNPPAYDQKIATDTIKQLLSLYPPAQTRFNIQQPTPDPFGAALIGGLRTNGYELLEHEPAVNHQTQQARPAADNAGKPGKAPRKGLDLRYVLDQQAGGNLYRVTVTVGDQSLTRPYMTRNDTLVPAGYWVRKE